MLPANLMQLLFREFNLILRMNWLVKHRVNLGCTSRRVTLIFYENIEIVMISEHRDYLPNVISTIVAEKLVQKACEAYLALVSYFGSTKLSVKDIRTVRNFSNVFPGDLTGIPLDREVEFNIELLPGTAPVSITLYRMAPKELMKLKTQLQELLNQGFFQPSVSPWEH